MPLSGDALGHLIREEFCRTALAKPMAEALVIHAMPGMLVPDHPEYVAWQEVMLHALILPRDTWEQACLVLRPSLSNQVANTHPLFTWMRDALYRPDSLSPDGWHAYVCAARTQHLDADVQRIARDYQDRAPLAHKRLPDLEHRLQSLLPALDDTQRKACMRAVRKQMNADRGLLDIRMALPTALDSVGGGDEGIREALAIASSRGDAFITASMPTAGVQNSTKGKSLPPGQCQVAALLVSVARDALLFSAPGVYPAGRYDTALHALVSLLRWPGQLRGAIDTTASALYAAEYVVTHGELDEHSALSSYLGKASAGMQTTFALRSPLPERASKEATNSYHPEDDAPNFNSDPHDQSIALETLAPLADGYRRAGYLIERDRRTEGFLRQQGVAGIPPPVATRPFGRTLPLQERQENYDYPASHAYRWLTSFAPVPETTTSAEEDGTPFMSGDLTLPPRLTLAGALTGPGEPIHQAPAATGYFAEGSALRPVAATPSRQAITKAAPWCPTFDSRGDVVIMHEALRQQQQHLQRQNGTRRKIRADSLYVPVGILSPASSYLSNVAPLLMHLKRSIAGGGRAVESEDLPDISTTGLRTLLNLPPLSSMDWKQPFDVTLSIVGGQTYNIHIGGTNLRAKPAVAYLGDMPTRLLTSYVTHLQRINGTSAMHALAVRDDGHVTLPSLLKFYGIDLPPQITSENLRSAIRALRPKAIAIAEASNDRGAPETSHLLIDLTNIPDPLSHDYDARGSSDYNVIAEHIAQACEKVHGDYAMPSVDRYGPSGEGLILRGLQQTGGIALTLTLQDTDGEDNTYVEHHAVNPMTATNLKAYFEACAELLGNYMIEKIRNKDGEDEGEINIGRIALLIHRPAFATRTFDISNRDVLIFDISSDVPPFSHADPASAKSDKDVTRVIGRLTSELRSSNGDVSQSERYLEAVNRVLSQDGVELGNLSEESAKSDITKASNEVHRAYYRISSGNIGKLQRLLVTLQPSEEEFLGRALCDHLGMDPSEWPVAIAHRLTVHYTTGPENTGSFLRGEDIASRTMLEIVYDQDLRKRIALATNRDDVCRFMAASLAGASVKPCDVKTLTASLSDFFVGFNMLDTVTTVSNRDLPESLQHPGTAFSASNARYIEDAADKYKRMEAERIVLTSASAATRVAEAGRASRLRMGPGEAVDFIATLGQDEITLLDNRTARFRSFLQSRRNTDKFTDLSSGWEQASQQLKEIGMEICRNAPLRACMTLVLLDDVIEGADAGTTAMDGLFFVSSVLHELRSAPLQRLGALLQQGTNVWALELSVEAYRAAVKEGRYADADKSLANIIMSGHSVLASGAAMIERLHERITTEHLQETDKVSQPDDRLFEELAPIVPAGAASSDQYLVVDEAGTLSGHKSGREIISTLWDGDLLVEGGARAIKINHERDTVYMLNGLPCQAVRTPFGWLELRPLRDMSLNEHRWDRQTDLATVSYGRREVPPFPEGFAGAAVDAHTSPENAAAWYDNHVSTFDTMNAHHFDADGVQGASGPVHIGVLENKYVMEHDGGLETIEHGGSKGGETTFVRDDGSAFKVAAVMDSWPMYRSTIEARVESVQGMFAVAEVAGAVKGLVAKRTVSGVIASRHTGSQEMIIELDTGVHYRGALPAHALPTLAPGERADNVQPFVVYMEKMSTLADPKRASPAVWRSHGAYRDSAMARDDFALELLFGAKVANNAYSKNYPWVLEHQSMIDAMHHALPPEVRDMTNPYYELKTTPADAILFAPRNLAVLADTLIAKDVEWGTLSAPSDKAAVEDVLRKIHAATPEATDAPGTETRSPLLEKNQFISADADDRAALYTDIKQKLGNANLVVAEVETKNAKKATFVAMNAPDEANVVVTGPDPVSSSRGSVPPSAILVETPGKRVFGISGGSIVDQIEAQFPVAGNIQSIGIFSLDPIPKRLASDIFISSTKGYAYRSITHLLPDSHVTDSETGETNRATSPRTTSGDKTVHAATIDLRQSKPIATGETKGAYLVDGHYYIKLDNGITYKALWDATAIGFRLVSDSTVHAPVETLPLARMTLGRFRLTNVRSPVARTTSLVPADLERLRRDLAKNPTPLLLEGLQQHGGETIIVADPAKVEHRPELDGRVALIVEGVEYRLAIVPGESRAYIRESVEEELAAGCSRHARGIEPLCGGGAGSFIESRNPVTGADLPVEGTDRPDAETWTPWASETRVYVAKPASEMPGTAAGVLVVPYERRYCSIDRNTGKPIALKKGALKIAGLPATPTYKGNVDAHLLRREGHGAQVRIRHFDSALSDATMELGASVFRQTGTDIEWIIARYDGAWYLGSFHRSAGEPTAREIPMNRMQERELLTDQEREIQRLHTGMHNANYHAKTLGPDVILENLEVMRHLGINPAQFERSEYFDTTTTGGEAYLFDRATREQVQTRVRTEAGWEWQRLDQVGSTTEVAQSRDDMLQISRTIFADRAIETIDDLLKMSADKKIPLGPKNFLIFRINGEKIYFSISGLPSEKTTPAMFKDGGTAQIDVSGKKQTIIFIDADPNMRAYMEELDRGMEYPRALPTAATPEQIDLDASVFDLSGTRQWDTERKMIAYLTHGQAAGESATVTSVEVLNRNDACKSCALILQQYFKHVPRVIHFYGNDYTKY